MLFGVAKETITPAFPVKIACNGRYAEDSIGIHDDVFCRCLVMDDGKSKLILLSYDLLFHDRELNNTLAEYAHQTYGVSPSALVVSYTHAHTAPASRGYNPGHHNDCYEAYLVEQGKHCIDTAMCSMFEGTLTYGSGDTFHNCSRRGYVNGESANAPAPDRERDTELFVLCVRDQKQVIRSIFVNYACHPVFYPTRDSISAEFPGRLCQLLDAQHYGCTSLFMQSAGGDVRPALAMDPTPNENGEYHWYWNEMTFAQVDQLAKGLQEDVNTLLCNAMKPVEPDFASDEFTIDMPMNPAPLSHFEEMIAYHVSPDENPDLTNAKLIFAGAYDSMPRTLPLHCQTIRLAPDLYLATTGGEPCFPVKQLVQSAFDEKKICFIGYTDACAYVVSDAMLEEGGYEPGAFLEYGLIGPFKKGLDAKYISGFRDSLNRVRG